MTEETTSGVRMEGLTLPVSDLERSLAFYRDLLGFDVEVRSDRFALLRIGGGTLGLLRAKAPGPAGPRLLGLEPRSYESMRPGLFAGAGVTRNTESG